MQVVYFFEIVVFFFGNEEGYKIIVWIGFIELFGQVEGGNDFVNIVKWAGEQVGLVGCSYGVGIGFQ